MARNPLTLSILDDTFAVCRLDGDTAIPRWAIDGGFFSITRTQDEVSIVCRQAAVPAGLVCERDWRCLRVVGTLRFSEVGILAALTVPLAEAGMSVFALSTFDTDHLLVKKTDLAKAIQVLRRQGHTIS